MVISITNYIHPVVMVTTFIYHPRICDRGEGVPPSPYIYDRYHNICSISSPSSRTPYKQTATHRPYTLPPWGHCNTQTTSEGLSWPFVRPFGYSGAFPKSAWSPLCHPATILSSLREIVTAFPACFFGLATLLGGLA